MRHIIVGVAKSFWARARLASMLLVLACGAGAIPAEGAPPDLQLAYQATFPNGSTQASVDHLGVGPMQLGSSLIANSNPTFAQLPGELFMSVTRPVGLPASLFVSAGAFATPVDFGPGSISRASATFRAPIGPLAAGGWAVAVIARTGGQNNLNSDTLVVATLNMRPGGVLRLNVPFGATTSTFVVLPMSVRDEIFSAVSPRPFTIDLAIDRLTGAAKAELTVENNVFSLPFVLAAFRANGGPTITAMGAAIANANAAGQTVSVHLRDFRIYD
jgi:hypothetical protein